VESSVNVISLKVLESDEGYPIDVFGTVIARDEVDYKCVYLFKRGRNDPQHICSEVWNPFLPRSSLFFSFYITRVYQSN
jgi:hypothetical protein